MGSLSNKKRVLLVAPSYMNLYEDIRNGLIGLGYSVTFYPDLRLPGDPFNKARSNEAKQSVPDFIAKLDALWAEILQKDVNLGVYDYLLVIDGLSVPPSLLIRLKELNPDLVACNFLYDRIRGVYEVDRNFAYYDRIYTFDLADSEEYHLHFLPIYWVPMDGPSEIERTIFGFGAVDHYRLKVFKSIKKDVKFNKKPSFIKLYSKDSYPLLFLKNLVKRLMGKSKISVFSLPPAMITSKALSPDEFRAMILSSDIILDTNHLYQDGLTARFMWALGAEKKIITTNKSVRNYSFYSEDQIYIWGEDQRSIDSFFNSQFEMSDLFRERIAAFRIDNWLRSILTDR